MIKNLISVNDIDEKLISSVFYHADNFRHNLTNLRYLKSYTQRFPYLMGTIFFEPSTRTRISFEAAMRHLGGAVVTMDDENKSSQAKGENFEDTIKTISQYVDLLVLRHPTRGYAKLAAEYCDVPLINAGDGDGEHPTQALLDLYTIKRELGRYDNLNILFFGDIEYSRTKNSLEKLLLRYENNTFMEEASYYKQGDDEFCKDLWVDKLKIADVIYITRNQYERWSEGKISKNISIGQEEIDLIKKNAIILHPLPRNNEINKIIDNDPRVAYWRQVKNGLYVRMALIHELINNNE